MRSIRQTHGFGIAAVALIAFGGILALSLPGCSSLQSAATTTIPVNLSTAQAEAGGLLAAIDALTALQPQTPMLTAAVADAQKAVTAFQALPATGSYLTEAEAVVNELQPVLALLPIPAPTKAAINGGIALLEGLAGGLTSVSVAPAQASAALGAVPTRVIDAPIPIPVPAS